MVKDSRLDINLCMHMSCILRLATDIMARAAFPHVSMDKMNPQLMSQEEIQKLTDLFDFHPVYQKVLSKSCKTFLLIYL